VPLLSMHAASLVLMMVRRVKVPLQLVNLVAMVLVLMHTVAVVLLSMQPVKDPAQVPLPLMVPVVVVRMYVHAVWGQMVWPRTRTVLTRCRSQRLGLYCRVPRISTPFL